MSKRNRAKKRQRRKLVCQECGYRGAVACYLPDKIRTVFRTTTVHGRKVNGYGYLREEKPDEVLCGEHAAEAGYCRSCGDFWGGIESFEFHHPGLCDHCATDGQDLDFDEEDDYD